MYTDLLLKSKCHYNNVKIFHHKLKSYKYYQLNILEGPKVKLLVPQKKAPVPVICIGLLIQM